MSKLVLFLFGLSLVLATVDAKKGGCKAKDMAGFRTCLSKGFQTNSTWEGCVRVDGKPGLKPREKQRCTALEKKMVNCKFDCGKKVPMTAEQVLVTCSHKDRKFSGADMFSKIYTKIQDCVRDCLQSESCKAISYNKSDKKCYFKTTRGGSSGPTVSVGWISTNMECDRSRVDLKCVRRGFYYEGADIKYLVTDKIEDCVLLCRDTDNCKALSYRDTTKYCYLKSQQGGSSGPEADASYRSLNMKCDNKPVGNMDCMREGIWFYSADLNSLAVANAKECVQQCKETESCKAISYRESDHQCFLKSRYGGYYPQVSSSYKSLSLKCDNSKVDNLDCMRDGFDFEGANMGNLVVADEVACVKHCRDTEGCKSITFRESDSRCYLKSRYGGDTGPNPLAGHKSMNMVCNNKAVRNLGCIRKDTNFPGADLRNFIVESRHECVRHCRDNERCKALTFTFSGGQIRCYMKYRRGGATIPVAAEGYSSMNMECDNSNVTNLDCLRKDLYFSGADIGNTIVADEEACVRLCRDTEGCKGFSFRLSNKRCYAKSRRGGSSGPSHNKGYRSMNMECDNSPVGETLKCLRRGINFPSSDLTSIVVADEAECVSHCRDTEDCVALSFRESNHYCYLKNKRGGYSGPTVSPGYNSLNLECDNTKPTQLKCQLKDDKFPGHDIRSLVTANFDQCLRRCRDTEGCKAVSFSETDNVCELKSEKYEWWRIKSHYISTNMDC